MYISKYFSADSSPNLDHYRLLTLKKVDWSEEVWEAFLKVFELRNDVHTIEIDKYSLDAFYEKE